MWHVYILQTVQGQLYTGITKDIERRMKEHKRGGCRFTRVFKFEKLMYSCIYPSRSEALKREAQIKRWPKTKKLALIAGEIE